MEERYYLLGLSSIKGLGSVKMAKLLQHFGDVTSLWQASVKELRAVEGIGSMANKIDQQRKRIDLTALLDKIKSKNIHIKTILDDDYPADLRNIYDPPPVLFYKGQYIVDEPTVAVVGSRRSTAYGRKTAEKIGYELAERGITVVSGMARGIDTHGHLGALKAKGGTIAVLGSGLDVIYPPENKGLFEQIAREGMVVSEFPPGVEPLPGNFPQRNRIISGLSSGVVVIEASTRSGSLITADLALEQGREVFAVPGNIDRPQSKGTNSLLKKGAKIVTCIEDIVEELYLYNYNHKRDDPENKKKTFYPQLSDDEKSVVELLQLENELHINDIIDRTGKSASKVNTALLKLELKGIVSREAGKKYSFLGLQNLLKPL